MWYKRHEAQRRYTLFYISVVLAGAFAGLLASAIGLMDGVRGIAGWRWIFILEGLATCVCALFFYFLFPDFPEDAKWLNEEERAFVKGRLREEQGGSQADKTIGLKETAGVFKDWKVWIGGLMYFAVLIPGYGYGMFCTSLMTSFNTNTRL